MHSDDEQIIPSDLQHRFGVRRAATVAMAVAVVGATATGYVHTVEAGPSWKLSGWTTTDAAARPVVEVREAAGQRLTVSATLVGGSVESGSTFTVRLPATGLAADDSAQLWLSQGDWRGPVSSVHGPRSTISASMTTASPAAPVTAWFTLKAGAAAAHARLAPAVVALRARRPSVHTSVRPLPTLSWTPPRRPAPSPTGSPSASGSPSVSPSPSASGSASPSAPPSVSPSPSPSGSSSGCVVGAKLVPSCGALWGLYTPYASGSWTTAYLNAEALTGRRFAVVKRYHDWSGAGSNGAFPDASEQQLSAGGRLLFLAWESRVFGQSGTVSWSRIAAGDYDSAIVRPEAERIKAFGRPVFLDFDHEMDTSVWAGAGLPADYVAAYRHIHDVFAQVGASNVVWVWTSTGYLGAASKIAASYPGDAYVDWIGYDPYNFNSCNGTAWKTADQTIDPFYQWLMANGHQNKPFMLAEYGSTLSGQSSSEVGSWYSSMVSALQSHPNIKAALEFNSASQGPKGLCDSRVTTSGDVTAGFAAAGRQPYVSVTP